MLGEIAMNTYFSRELVEQVNSQMKLGCVNRNAVLPQVRSFVESKTPRELSDTLSWAWRKNARN